jgi:hypothetical protein
VDIKNVCRSLLTVGVHPDDETSRAIAVAKTNLGIPCDALTYQLHSVDVMADDDTVFQVARVVWTGTAPIHADALTLAQPDGEAIKSALEDACDGILEFLSTGRKTAHELEEHTKRMGISQATFRRARKRLHDTREIEKSGGGRLGGPVTWMICNRDSSQQIESHDPTRDCIQGREILFADEAIALPVTDGIALGATHKALAALSSGSKLCRICHRLDRCLVMPSGNVCRQCAVQSLPPGRVPAGSAH